MIRDHLENALQLLLHVRSLFLLRFLPCGQVQLHLLLQPVQTGSFNTANFSHALVITTLCPQCTTCPATHPLHQSTNKRSRPHHRVDYTCHKRWNTTQNSPSPFLEVETPTKSTTYTALKPTQTT
ncbi:hypothetical protein KC19_12G013100, partial [Ceratodon purpureus]